MVDPAAAVYGKAVAVVHSERVTQSDQRDCARSRGACAAPPPPRHTLLPALSVRPLLGAVPGPGRGGIRAVPGPGVAVIHACQHVHDDARAARLGSAGRAVLRSHPRRGPGVAGRQGGRQGGREAERHSLTATATATSESSSPVTTGVTSPSTNRALCEHAGVAREGRISEATLWVGERTRRDVGCSGVGARFGAQRRRCAGNGAHHATRRAAPRRTVCAACASGSAVRVGDAAVRPDAGPRRCKEGDGAGDWGHVVDAMTTSMAARCACR